MIIQSKAWGNTKPLFLKNNVEIHHLHIDKGGYCSVHRHASKFNQFIVLKGKLKVTIRKNYLTDIIEDVTILEQNMETTVSPGEFHTFEALEDTECLEIYWVQLNPNDIERITYGGRLS